MKLSKDIIYGIIISILIILLIIGYNINKKNSYSKRNEISNLNLQIKVKNKQLANIQKKFLNLKSNINDFINEDYIKFSKVFENKKLENINNFELSKYKTEDVLFGGNYRALASAYIDFYNDDTKLILVTSDGIFATSDLNNLNKFNKIKSNFLEFVNYKKFYTHTQYGVKDILVNDNDIYVSIISQLDKNCYNFRLLKSKITQKKLTFKIFYEIPECVKEDNDHQYYAGQGAGGRMYIRNNSILLTTGEFRNRPLAQNKKSFYGKILEINLDSKKAEVVSFGHRNAQGIYYSKSYDFIISTEHGPKGGDEININHKPFNMIKNFGWPISSYGEHYYKNHPDKILKEAPLNKSHKKFGFEEPIKYFVPSIGISEIISITKNDDQFLIGAMGNEIVEQDLGLHLIKLDNEKKKVIKHKYIPLNERVRDMIISKDKKIIIMFLETTSSLAILRKNS